MTIKTGYHCVCAKDYFGGIDDVFEILNRSSGANG